MNLLNLVPSASFVYMWVRVVTPIVFASLGAAIRTKAGVINLGLEGIVLISALVGVLRSAFGGNLVWGVAAGMLAAVVMSAVFAYLRFVLKANNVLCGTAVNTMVSGLTAFMLQLATGEKGSSSSLKNSISPSLDIPVIKDTPVIRSILLDHNSLTYVTLVMVAVIWFFLYKTPTGLRMRAVGENPDVASSVGQNMVRTQFPAIVLCGFMAGLGGMYLSMDYLSIFVRDMTAGRRFISLVACSTGQVMPVEAPLSPTILTFFDGLSNVLQVFKIPSEFIQILPYLTTIVGFTTHPIQKPTAADRKIEKLREVQS